MIAVTDHDRGAMLPVRARPGARFSGLDGEYNGSLKVAVKARAVDGKANEALLKVLAEALHVPRSRLTMVAGLTSRDKRFLVEGLSASQLRERLRAALGPTLLDGLDDSSSPATETPRTP